MEDRVQKAIENHKNGYNCCQAVACAYSDLFNIDEDTMFKISEGFGAGIGCMQGVCGALSGAVILAGLKNSSGDASNPTTKASTYKLSKELLEKFKNKNSSIFCKDLKGLETKKLLRSCDGCIEDAAKLVSEILIDN